VDCIVWPKHSSEHGEIMKAWCKFCDAFWRQCVNYPLSCSALGIAVLLWIIPVVTLILMDSSPVVFLGNDSVSPQVVKAGETVAVTRNIEFKTSGTATITRKLRTAGCHESCTDIELDSGTISYKRGERRINNTKIHNIPLRTPAGMWDLKFALTTSNFLGQKITTEFPVLTIEVVR